MFAQNRRRLVCPNCRGAFEYDFVAGGSFTAVRLLGARYMRCPLCHRFGVFDLYRAPPLDGAPAVAGPVLDDVRPTRLALFAGIVFGTGLALFGLLLVGGGLGRGLAIAGAIVAALQAVLLALTLRRAAPTRSR